jgi:acid phosphatase class B
MLILCGITHFRVGDVIYFKTSTTPSKGSGAIEIVESEFKAAEIALNLTGEIMAGYLCVSGCEVQDMGSKRIYHLNDNSVVI